MTSASSDGGPWAELGEEDVRTAFGGSAVVNDAFQRLKDEIERVLAESVAVAQEADREAAATRHKLEEKRGALDRLQLVLNARTALLEKAIALLKSLVDLPLSAPGYDDLRTEVVAVLRRFGEQR